jgi:mono/diheme cytochrome c family protein
MQSALLAKAGPWVGIVLLGFLLAGVLALVPAFARERSFRFNVSVLGGLLALVLVAMLVALAGGGSARQGPVVHLGSHDYDVQRVMLFALLAALVVLFTVALFRDYPHAGEVNLATAPEVDRDLPAVPSVPVAGNGDVAVAVAAEPDVRVEAITGPAPISLARWEWHHRTRLGLLMAVIVAAVFLAATSIVGTAGKPEYARSVNQSHRDAERVVELAGAPAGIPVEGAAWLLRRDPKTQGPRLFAQHCASCHGFNGTDGTDGNGGQVPESPSAPDLAGFASREWIKGLMDPATIDSEKYYGPRTKAHAGKMVKYVKEDVAKFNSKEQDQLRAVIKALSAEAKLPSQAQADAADAAEIAAGRKFIGDAGLVCTDCHTFHGEKGKGGPDLTGYGSREWLTSIISNPAHPKLYGKDNDRMPAFGDDKLLTQEQIGLVADWLRGEWYEPGRDGESAKPPAAAGATRPAETQPTTQR